jgi:hypothetical protein
VIDRRLLSMSVILRAAAASKHAKGGGLAGYLTDIADNNKELFVPLLAKALLQQAKERARTANRFRAAPIAQGIGDGKRQ